jgi:hypothetical protein
MPQLAHNFVLTINLDNDAFTGKKGLGELARLLRVVADRIESGKTSGKVQDVNGNTVGNHELTP